jgi:hypothetical protein
MIEWFASKQALIATVITYVVAIASLIRAGTDVVKTATA